MTSVSVLIGITLGFLLKRHATEGKESLGKQKKHKICLASVPISILCKVVRRIIAKAFLSIIGDDIQIMAGPLQLRVGQMAGVDAVVH